MEKSSRAVAVGPSVTPTSAPTAAARPVSAACAMACRREVVLRVIGMRRILLAIVPVIPSHFAELLDFLPDVLAWVKDRQGRYLWVNRAFLIQYSLDHPAGKESAAVENIQGKTDYELSPAFLADQFRHDDEQVLAGHRIVNRLERVGESQGTTVWHIAARDEGHGFVRKANAEYLFLATVEFAKKVLQP